LNIKHPKGARGHDKTTEVSRVNQPQTGGAEEQQGSWKGGGTQPAAKLHTHHSKAQRR